MTNQRYRNLYLDNHSHFCTASIVDFLLLLTEPQDWVWSSCSHYSGRECVLRIDSVFGDGFEG